MSEIPFVNRLGDALDAAIAERATSTQRRRRHWRPRWLGPRVAAGLAVLALGGGVAAAAVVISQSSTTLVAHGVSCISGTGHSAAKGAYGIPLNGQSPIDRCAAVMGVSAGTLVACAGPASDSGVAVYESDGDADQCESLGLESLPADYAAATAQVNQLERALAADYDSAPCIPAEQLAQEADADLHRLGFVGWRAVIEPPGDGGYAGPCGQFPASGRAASDPAAALEAYDHTVMIDSGAPESTLQLANRVVSRAEIASSKSCYTLTGAQQLVHEMLDRAAGHTVPVEFAATQEEVGTQMLDGSGVARNYGGQKYYAQGCTLVGSFATKPDGQTFLVRLLSKTGASPGAPNTYDTPLPASAYQPTLTQG